jgi:hypothetical protein
MYTGRDGFVWFYGVVEDRQDPLKIGRCRVRCFGWHTDDKTKLPTNLLPWAVPIQPITSAATSGVGESATGMVEGSFVVGFFMDGENAQEPMIMGTVAGVPVSKDSSKGFSDPNGVYPKELNVSDTPARAKGDRVTQKITEESSSAFGVAWVAPTDPYNASYPKNHVIRSESGHMIEVDDTPGSERINIQHKDGSYTEYHRGGDRMTKVTGSDYEIITNGKNIKITGSCNIEVSGSCNLKAGSVNVQTEKMDIEADTYRLTVKSDAYLRYDGNVHTHIGSNTYSRHEEGYDHTCPTDPVRLSNTSCVEVETAIGETVTTVGNVTLYTPYSEENKRAIINSIFVGITPTEPQRQAVTEEDNPIEPVTINTPLISCGEFGNPVTTANYSSRISDHFTLADVSIRALFPHALVDQNGLTQDLIACNLKQLSVNVLDPVRDHFGNIFRVNSGFRTRANGRSDHEYGQAADLQFPGYTREQTYQAALWIKENIPSFKQVIFENIGNSSGWVHVAYANSRGTNNNKVLTTVDGRRYTPGLTFA